MIPEISLADYFYELLAEKIAERPPAERGASKLLVADVNSGKIRHEYFRLIAELIPEDALLVMNDTRVIAARLILQKSTGGAAEILCLNPVLPSKNPALALQSSKKCTWQCMIGGRKINDGDVLSRQFNETTLSAEILEKNGGEAVVEFSWTPNELSFASVLEQFGETPLPPYIKRKADDDDAVRYQTVYAMQDGSVAAPTAGLHFTEEILDELEARGVKTENVTLHVGAGTFKPISATEISQHEMHKEQIFVAKSTIANLREQLKRRAETGKNQVIAVGTTSARTLETLYWLGVKWLVKGGNTQFLEQWEAYFLRSEIENLPTAEESFAGLLAWLERNDEDILVAETRLCIVPSYRFAVCDGLITNFHQPESTLILLVAAFLGKNLWQKAYSEALANEYRFLSYGDSSFLIGFPQA